MTGKHLQLSLIPFLLTTAMACSDSSFKADATQGAVPEPEAVTGGSEDSGQSDSTVGKPELGEVTGGKVSVDKPTPEDEKHLAKCASLWGGKAPAYSKDAVRKIAASVSVGGSGVMLSDLQKTEAPQVTIIYSAVAVGGTPEWHLLNPNGYYCIVSSVNVGTQLTVTIDKNAHLADSAVAVNVGSQADQAVAAVGVNVGSTIKVIKK